MKGRLIDLKGTLGLLLLLSLFLCLTFLGTDALLRPSDEVGGSRQLHPLAETMTSMRPETSDPESQGPRDTLSGDGHVSGDGAVEGDSEAIEGGKQRALPLKKSVKAEEPGCDLTVQVVDEDGLPLLGCEVSASTLNQTTLATPAPGSALGLYELESPSCGFVHVAASRHGFAPAEHLVRLPHDEQLRIHLFSPASLSIRVVDEEGRPIQGAAATARYADERKPVAILGASDAEGAIDYEVVPTGVARLSVSAEGYAPMETANLELLAVPVVNQFDITLTPGAKLIGEVIDRDGEPVPHMRVTAFRPPISLSPMDPPSRTAPGTQSGTYHYDTDRTDRDGRFFFDHLPDGEYEVSVQLPATNKEAGFEPVSVSLVSGRTTEATIRERSATRFSIRGVIMVDDAPLIGAKVATTGWMKLDAFRAETATNGSGEFTLSSLDPGQHLVSLALSNRSVDYGGASFLIHAESPPSRRINFRFESQPLSGVVLDAEGAPVESVRLSLRGEVACDGLVGKYHHWIRSDSTGAVDAHCVVTENSILSTGEPRRLAPHSLTPSIYSEGPVQVPLSSFSDPSSFTLRLGSSAVLRGAVLNASGEACFGARVEVKGEGRSFSPLLRHGDALPNGEFAIAGLGDETLHVRATCGAWTSRWRECRVTPGETTEVQFKVQ